MKPTTSPEPVQPDWARLRDCVIDTYVRAHGPVHGLERLRWHVTDWPPEAKNTLVRLAIASSV